MNWYLKALRQFADFNGRARRKEYWMFFLFNMIFAIVAMLLDNIGYSKYKLNELDSIPQLFHYEE
jgi:uncharacterized membrane protein YhaH (DUF805 family)